MLQDHLFPRFRAFFSPAVLRIIVLRPFTEVCREKILIFLKDRLRDVPEPFISELTILKSCMREEAVCRRFTFVLPEIIGGCRQRSLKTTEEHGNLELRPCPGDKLITVICAVKIQKLILAAQHLSALVQFATVHTDIFVLCRLGHHDGFPGF